PGAARVGCRAAPPPDRGVPRDHRRVPTGGQPDPAPGRAREARARRCGQARRPRYGAARRVPLDRSTLSMPGRATPTDARVPVLARLRVGTKLLLLVLLPVCGLLAVTALATRENWRDAARLRDFRAATQLSFPVAAVARAVELEGVRTVVYRLRTDPAAPAELASARRSVDQTLRTAGERSAGHDGPVDVAGRLDAIGRQVRALRLQVNSGLIAADAISDGYGVI